MRTSPEEAGRLSEESIRKELRSEALQHPATMIPLALAGLSLIHLMGISPFPISIVLLSDGKDTSSSRTQNEMLRCLPKGESITGVKIFTIAYGDDADAELLSRIANRTNGRMFAGDQENIEKIYNAISAEQ